jgi:NADH-quinone oxidoreductase subunit G
MRTVPGEQITKEALDEIARVAKGRSGPIVVVLGRPSLAESPAAVMRSAAALAGLPGVRFLSALRRANVHGALDAGLAPGFLPGRVTLDAGRDWYTDAWGGVPRQRGLDAEGILRAAADGKVRVLVLLGADPVCDFPDSTLARRAIETAGTVIAVDAFLSESTKRADVFLPCTLWGEKAGHVTNIEGRVQRLGRKVAPEGTAMDDWRIAVELGVRLGHDIDLATVDEVADAISHVAPAQLGATAALLRSARDGVVLPVREHFGEVVVRTGELTILADDGSGTSWDPIKIEGVEADATTNIVEAKGAGAEPLEPGEATPGALPEHVEKTIGAAQQVAALAETAPELHVWDRSVPSGETPARDAYGLRLVVGHTLYDSGRVVAETPVLQAVRRSAVLRISEHDATRLGIEAGGEMRVTSARGSHVMPVIADAGVPAGVAHLAFGADGTGAAEMIDVSLPVTDLRLETVR